MGSDLPDRLFRRDGGSWSEFALSPRLSVDMPYSLVFKEAGDALVDRAIERHEQDLLLFPALYCYRHAAELEMKEIVRMARRANGTPKSSTRHGHRLQTLWPEARRVIEDALSEGDTSELDAVGLLIGELAAVDPDAQQFRYERDPQGRARRLPAELERVDLRYLAEGMQRILRLLSGARDAMWELLGFLDEQAHGSADRS